VQLTVFAAGESAGFLHRLIEALQQLARFLQKKLIRDPPTSLRVPKIRTKSCSSYVRQV
jgi:hypothetical protein